MAEKVNTVTLLETLSFHWKHALKYPKQVALSFIVGPISIIGERYIAPIFIAALLTAIQMGTATIENSIWLIVGYAAVQIIAFVIGYRVNLFAMWSVQIHGARDINQQAYESIARHSLQFHNNRFAGSIVSQVGKTASSFFAFWNMIVFEVMFAVVAIIATLIGVSFISLPLTVILAVFVTIFIISAYFGTRFMRPRQIARSKAYSKVSGQLSDSISNMVAVKIESKEKGEEKRLSGYLEDVLIKEKSVRKGVMTTTSVTSVIVAFARISALVVAVWAVQTQTINAGAVFLLITYTFNLLMEVWNINTALRTMYQISGDSEELLAIMKAPVDIQDTSAKKLKATNGTVVIDNVTFAHEVGDNLFEGLNLTIPAGQKVGVVGVSGSGKSTLTKLLLRLSDPKSGSIKIDGQDIAEVSQVSLHDAIAYVPQEPLLFHRSLHENISYSRPKATENEVKNAAKDAQAYNFIKVLDKGFETLVGERGVKLSGGQRQRIAIARAILKQAPVLILDEATSALDSESEQLIQKALEKLMEGRTSIVIAHRLSTISKLDRIIVMENGKIIEDGNHQELLEQKGMYAKLWAHQSGGFIEE
ncbi:MAG: ABC transporter ATP-binding protein [Patescibacteria group bacterium]